MSKRGTRATITGPFAVGTFGSTQSFTQMGTPGGWTQAFIRAIHQPFEGTAGTAMTGDSQGLRVRVENSVASMTGQLRAIQMQAKNNNDSASGSMQAYTAETLCNGKNLSVARGNEIICDNTAGTGTITTMVGSRIRVIGAGTVTNGPWGLQIVNDSESASASAKPLKAFIRCESAVATTVNSCVIDATESRINGTALYSVTLTADDNVLFYYKDKDGTAHAVVASDADALAIRT